MKRRSFLAATGAGLAMTILEQFAERAKREKWNYHEIDASHSPHVTAPDDLARLLSTIIHG